MVIVEYALNVDAPSDTVYSPSNLLELSIIIQLIVLSYYKSLTVASEIILVASQKISDKSGKSFNLLFLLFFI